MKWDIMVEIQIFNPLSDAKAVVDAGLKNMKK